MSDQSPHSVEEERYPERSGTFKELKTPTLQGKHIDTLVVLAEHGPCWCGDVPSKSARDDLVEWGYAISTWVKGEEGYYVLTHSGAAAYKKQFGGDTVPQAMRNRKAALAALGD